MTDFYLLDSAEQMARIRDLAAQALTLWEVDYGELSLIKYRENAVFKVVTVTGERYALRIHRPGYHSNAALRSELQWINALDQSGIEVPAIVPTITGEYFAIISADGVPEPRQADLFQWVSGEPMGSIEKGQFSSLDEVYSTYHRIGTVAARLHNQAAFWQLPEGFTRHAWDADGLTGEQPFWGPFWEFEMLNDEQRQLLLRARAKVHQDLIAYGKSPETYSMIHADFVVENLMIDGEHIRLIDFDDAGFGWHLFELATALYFIINEDYYETARNALIQGYREHRALPDEQLKQLPLFLLARGFTYLGWAQTRKETETAQEMGPIFIEVACRLAREYLRE